MVDWRALVERARAGGSDTVRVWISACATGEEAYTFAMLASEALGPRPPVSILVTDISTAALELAHAARYSERSLRNLTPAVRKRHFEPEGSQLSVRQSLRSLVRFRHHNLVSDPAPPAGEVAFDVIACRNVLIYFDGPTVERVIGSLESALRPEGLLVLGVADRLSGSAGRLARTSLAAPAAERRARRTPRRVLRRPLGLEGSSPRELGRQVEDRIEDALEAADRGDLDAAIAISGQLSSVGTLTTARPPYGTPRWHRGCTLGRRARLRHRAGRRGTPVRVVAGACSQSALTGSGWPASR